MAIAQAMMGTQGWANAGSALGQALSGGGDGKKYDEAMLRGHRTQRALMDAQKATLEYQKLGELQESLGEVLGPDAEALTGFIANSMIARRNPQQAMQAARTHEQYQATLRAKQAAESGDVNAMNREIAISRNVPLEQTRVQGNTLISPFEAMSGQTPVTTPYGQGQLANQAARVQGQNAAAMYRAQNPVSRSSGGRAGDDGIDREYNRVLKDAAQAMLSDAKLKDYDVSGLTVTDVMQALRSNGEFVTRDGKLMGRFNITPETMRNPPPDFSGVQGGSRTVPRQPPAAPVPGAPAPAAPGFSTPSAAMSGAPVTEPRGARPAESIAGLPPRLDYAGGGDGVSRAPVVGRRPGQMPEPAAAATPTFEQFEAMQSTELPPQARARLREGEITTFANGQQWVLDGGRPIRLK